jgi:hypothetical protein
MSAMKRKPSCLIYLPARRGTATSLNLDHRGVDAARGLTGDDHARGQGHLKSQENFQDDNPERDIPIDDWAEVAGPETIRKMFSLTRAGIRRTLLLDA